MHELNEEKLDTALNEILNNQSYKNSAIRYSKLFRETPIKPMDLPYFGSSTT